MEGPGFINPLSGTGGFSVPGQGVAEDPRAIAVREMLQKLQTPQPAVAQQQIAPTYRQYVAQFGEPKVPEDIRRNVPNWNDFDEASRTQFEREMGDANRAQMTRGEAIRRWLASAMKSVPSLATQGNGALINPMKPLGDRNQD